MIRLHHAHQTRSMRSLWLLNELGVEFDLVIHPFDRSLRSPEYLGLNPAGRVPALEIDGARLFETGAITQVLCERFPQSGLGRAPGHPERADWLVWVHFSETLSQHTAALTQQHVALYEDHMRSPIVTRLEAKRLEKCYAAIEARLSELGEQGDYLLAGGFSAADISVGQAVYMGRYFARLDGFERLQAWYDRISERPGFEAALPPDGAGIYGRDFYPPLEDPA
ncbi:MAG: glutathione S-transferase family protein [Litoreibacter sp.]|nr:glutathione S-transferase family protein [Litoreibacter sp.]